jgi:putative membrane protein
VTAALDHSGPSALLTHWTVQPLALVVVVLVGLTYLRGVRRVNAWPARRTVMFTFGLALLVWATCGYPQVYAPSLYWVWTTQTLVIWLGVPIIVLGGRPVHLARAAWPASGRIERFLRSRFARVVGNPLVAPALVPLLSAVLFFGPLPGWAIEFAPAGWVLQIVLLVVGSLMVLPLVGLDENASSLAVGLSLAIGSFELVLDALPGVILRLHVGLVTSFFHHRSTHAWSPHPLHDQRVAGAVLWCVAEVIDLPFMYLVYRRWLRADARDAAQVDAVLEAERAARQGMAPLRSDRRDSHGNGHGNDGDFGDQPQPPVDRDEPWWLSDPAMRKRLHGGRG